MAKKNPRIVVWLICPECKGRNYREERGNAVLDPEKHPENRLVKKKYCRKCQTHTAHRESRTK